MFLMDGLNFNQGDGEATLEDLDVGTISHAEIFRGANAFKYGALSLGGAINLVPFTGYDTAPFQFRLEGGKLRLLPWRRERRRGEGSSMNLPRLVSESAKAFVSIAVRTRKFFLPISVTSSATRWRIDFI